MSKYIAFAVSMALLAAPVPAIAAQPAEPAPLVAPTEPVAPVAMAEADVSGFKLAAQDGATAQTPTASDEKAEPDYRLERKKSGTGKKIAKGAAIGLGVVGVIVAGLFVFYRAKCGPNARDCSE